MMLHRNDGMGSESGILPRRDDRTVGPRSGAARGYRREWLRSDLVAGLVLAAILVPQGMAYAELAGPARGHRALHDHRVPGRLRDLRPVPRAGARARLVGLAADLRRHRPAPRGEGPGQRDRARGDAGAARRPHRDRARPRQARLRRRPALERGAGRLHERPRDHDHRRPAAEAVRLLHRRRRLRRRAARVVRPPRRHARRPRSPSGSACSSCCSCCPRVIPKIPAVLVAVAGATIVSAAFDLAAHGVATVGTLPQGFPTPSLPWTSFDDVGPLLLAAVGIVLVSLTDTIATASAFAAPARRRGRAQPGDDRHRRGRTSPPGSSRASRSRRAGRAPRSPSSRARRASSPASSARAWSRCCCCSSTRCSPTCRSRRSPAVVIAAALSLMNLGALRQYWTVRPSSLLLSLVATLGVVALRRARGHRRRDLPRGAAVLPPQLVAARRGARPHRRHRGLAQRRRPPGRARGPRHRRVPLGGTAVLRQRGRVPPADPPPRARRGSPAGSCCSARRSPTSTSPPPRCSSSSTTSSTPPASTWRSSRCAAGSRTSSASTASSRPSTATTSTPPSTPRSPPSRHEETGEDAGTA